jgi:hypothetical protein
MRKRTRRQRPNMAGDLLERSFHISHRHPPHAASCRYKRSRSGRTRSCVMSLTVEPDAPSKRDAITGVRDPTS